MSAATQNAQRGNDRISLTGYATASAWAHYGFEDAEWFDTRRGRALFWPLHSACNAIRPFSPGAGAFTETLYWRHHWFSKWTEAQSPGLAVEIGSGLTTRGISHSRHHRDCQWVDYDLPNVVEARNARLADERLPENYTLDRGDLLADGLGDALTAPESGRTIVLTEGVTDYLAMSEKRRAWRSVAALLERLGGGRYLLEIYPRQRLETFGPTARMLLATLRRITGRDLSEQLFDSVDQATSLLRECGFSRARVLTEDELEGAADAPLPRHRAFVLVAADV